MDERTADGFMGRANISQAQQQEYMRDRWQDYFIATVDGEPAGYGGCVGGDIRVCTHPDFFQKGVGLFLMQQLAIMFPSAVARVKVGNEASKRMVEAAGYVPLFVTYGKGK